MRENTETLLEKLKKEGKITANLMREFENLLGERFRKALTAVKEGAVKRFIFCPSLREVWIVVGRNREYEVIPRIYCNCEDFYINAIARRKIDLCYHLLAQAIAEALGEYSTYLVSDEFYEYFMKEWNKIG